MTEVNLTYQERKALLHIANGRTTEYIVRTEGISRSTLEQNLLPRLLRKLGAGNKSEAVHQAHLKGAFNRSDATYRVGRRFNVILTDREKGVLLRIANSFEIADIVKEDKVSRSTVDRLLASIFRKLGVNSQPEAVHQAHLKGAFNRSDATYRVGGLGGQTTTSDFTTLSSLECSVLALRKRGLSPSATAKVLQTSAQQVKNALNRAKTKLGAETIDETAEKAERLGLLDVSLAYKS